MRPDPRFILAALASLLLPVAAWAQGTTESGVKDFRGYVFAAYTAAFVLLFALIGYVFARQKGVTEEVEALKERLEKSGG